MWRRRSTGSQPVSLERILLLVIAGVAHVYGNTCPVDVPGDTQRCLDQYNSQLDAITSGGQNFYSGVDVEQLRLTCRYLQESARCAQTIKQNCPDTEHADIETTFSNHMPVFEMCHYKNFLEVYARNMFCFLRLSANSETCHNAFRAKAEDEIKNIYIGNQNTLVKYCSYFDELLDCVRTQVRNNCNHEAVSLVEVLVRPSVPISQHCKNETVKTTTVRPTPKKPNSHDSGNNAYSNKQTVNGGSRAEYLTGSLLLAAVLVMSYNTR